MARQDDIAAYRQAVERWIDALMARGDRQTTETAVHPTIRLERYGFGARQGQLVQIIEGPGPVSAWLAKTPEGCAFSLDDGPSLSGAGDDVEAIARYRLEYDVLINGGEWRFRLAEDGRIAWLSHRPRDLPPDAPVPEIKMPDNLAEVVQSRADPPSHAHPHSQAEKGAPGGGPDLDE